MHLIIVALITCPESGWFVREWNPNLHFVSESKTDTGSVNIPPGNGIVILRDLILIHCGGMNIYVPKEGICP
jgi:hypothetical protein